MKILILTNYANGLYLFRKELLTALLEDGHEIVVSVPPDENCPKVAALGVRLIETALNRRGMNPLRDAGLFFKYLSLLKQERPDAVFTYTIKPNLYGGLACRICRVPYIVNITGLGTAIESGGMLSRLLLLFYRISMKKARVVFFQNEENQGFMQRHGVALHNSALLPGSGVNLTEHPFVVYPSEVDGIRILAVIRIMRDKGIEEYLEAVRAVSLSHANVHFYLVGEYEEESRARYEPMISALTESGVLTYLGHIDYVAQVMAQSHIIVHPSYHEGLSNVLLEAAACGRPVAAGAIHGCMETFCEGVSGISFETHSALALIDAIERLLGMSFEQRRQMGLAGRRWVEERFDRQIIISEYRKELRK